MAESSMYLAEVVAELEREWPKNRTVTIVCHGHSVPAGYFRTPKVDSFNAYPYLLNRGLKERFPAAVINVITTAIGSETSVEGAARFVSDVLCHKPDIVTIDYSLNDRKIGLKRAHETWSWMISAAQAHGVKVILLTPTGDTCASIEDPADPLNLHAEQVRTLAEQYGVALADSLKAFRFYVEAGGRLGDLMSQANHPNRRGHDLVTARLLELFPASTRP